MVYRDAPLPPTRLSLAARTLRGAVRMVNEDLVVVIDLATGERRGPEPFAERRESASGMLLAVLDGMGGVVTGEDAVRVAAEVLHRRLGVGPPSGQEALRRALTGAVQEAGRAIFEAASTERRLQGMSATITAAAIAGRWLHLVHAGQTRAYLRRDGRLSQLTRDDTLENEAAAYGILAEQIAALPRGIVTKALGLAESVALSVETAELAEGDEILLCTDGLSALVTDAAIEAILGAHPAPADACAALVDAAVRAGGSDDITVIVAQLEGEEPVRRGLAEDRGAELSVLVAARSERGDRSANRDVVLVADLAARARLALDRLPLVRSGAPEIVLGAARGVPSMGDADAMAVAQTVVEALCRSVLAGPPPGSSDALRGQLAEAFREAARAAHTLALKQRHLTGARAQLTAAAIAGGRLDLAHLGAGRGYVLRRGRLSQVTRSVTRVLGARSEAEPDLESLPLRDGDVILLCTSGLAEALGDEDIEALLRAHPDPQSACDALVEGALRRDRRDNMTAIVAALRGPGLRAPGEEDTLQSRM